VHAAKDDVFGRGLFGGELRELETVAAKVGELDHIMLLIVMAKDDQSLAEFGFKAFDAGAQLWF
jgi:hypothetical protein